MKLSVRTIVVPILLIALLAMPGAAQTNVPAVPSDRFLLIVDTSAAMRERAPAVRKVLDSLLSSSMGAQIHRGDTLGVWTFNNELFAGRFPLQTWTPETAQSVASNVLGFLDTQTYEGESRYEVVQPVLQQVIAESPRLTVLLISDGDEPIAGTPFDWQIGRALTSRYRLQQREQMPFVTTLRAMRGQVVSATVSLAPWPVDFPKFPPEPKIVEQPKPGPKPEPAPQPTVPPLIVIGNKRVDPAAITNLPAIASTNTFVVDTKPAVTNEPPPLATTTEPVQPAPVVEKTPDPAPAQPTVTPISAVSNAVETAVASAVVSNPLPVEPKEIEVQTVTKPEPPPAVVEPEPPPVAVAPSTTGQADSTKPVPASTTAVAQADAKFEPPPPKSAVAEPTPAPSSTPEPTKAEPPASKPVAEQIETIAAATVTPAVVVPQASPATTTNATGLAVATPGQGGSVRWLLIVVGLVPIILGILVLLRLQRKSRSATGSLISHSFDRDRK